MVLGQLNFTEYISKETMELIDKNTCLSFIRTVWRNEPLMVVFNNLTNEVISIWFESTLQNDDMNRLTKLISNFLNK